MAVLNGLLALAAVLVFCGFFAQKFHLNAALLPLPVMGGIVLWLFLWGILSQLFLGGILVWVLLALALGWLIYKKELKEAAKSLLVPGVLFFAGASLFFLALFAVTKPMFIAWDEFTFWGTACRLTKLQNVLHPAAQGMLLARGYNPGLPVLAYFFQFFGSGFSEWSVYFALDTLFCAALSAVSAPLSKKNWPAAVLLLGTGLMVPFFFVQPALGGVSNVFVTAMGDLFLGSVFGASICIYLCCENKISGFVLTGVSLCFLTLIKDMGLAYALIAAGTICVDYLFSAGRPTLRRFGKTVGAGLALAVPVPVVYLVWSRYVASVSGLDKGTLGNWEKQLSPVDMVVTGTRQLLGLEEPTERVAIVRDRMLASPFNIPVCLLGGGVLALALVFAVMGIAALCLPKGEKHRPIVMAVILTAGLGAFLLFHFFLYAFMFAEQEALVLKDYARYIGPYYLGFFLLALGFLARSREKGTLSRLSRLMLLGLPLGFGLLIGLRGTPSAGFLDYPRSLYSEREEINRRAQQVNDQLDWGDKVLLIKQGEKGTGWNYYGYALEATLSGGFGGFGYGHPDDYTWPTTHMNIVSPDEAGEGVPEVYPYQTVCDAEDMKLFLLEKRYDYLLVDTPDEYFSKEMAPAFGLEGLPTERTDRDYLVKIDYTGNSVRWSLVNGEVGK